MNFYKCACGYKQDFAPTQENMIYYHPSVMVGTCPSCGSDFNMQSHTVVEEATPPYTPPEPEE